MAATQSTVTGGLISTISSWLSKDSEEKAVAKVVFRGTKITDSVYDLRPEGEQVEDFNVEIVFFHGLQLDSNKVEDSHFMTWVTDTDPPKSWPATILPKLFPKARLLSIKYDGTGTKSSTTGRDDLQVVIENLVAELIRNNRPFGAGVGQARAPVIFVTHCLGGVVAQRFILEVDKQLLYRPDDLKLKNFWNNLGGIVYYSPPFHRSDQFVRATCSSRTKGPLSQFMEGLLKESSSILQDFTKLLDSERLQPKPPSLVLAERFDTTRGGFTGGVVQKGSSSFGDNLVIIEGDHFSVCQPEDETSQSFQLLGNFVQEVVGSYVFAAPRSRGAVISIGGADSSPTKTQSEQSSAGGGSGFSLTPLEAEQVHRILEHGHGHVKNKISFDDQTLSKESVSSSGGSPASARQETADTIEKDTSRKSRPAGGVIESTDLTFFKSYD